MSHHNVKLEQFEGPFDLLLQLIEQEELDITAISLARVCEEYLARLGQVEGRAPEDVADFLLVAAKLLYLKSLALLPGAIAESAEDTTGLTEQLRLYRAFIEAAQKIDGRWRSGAVGFSTQRTPVRTVVFAPPPRCTIATLSVIFAAIVAELEPIVRIPRAVIGRRISIEERIAKIRQLITGRDCVTFDETLQENRTNEESIVNFLAILELVRQRFVDVIQLERFGPIRIERIVGSAVNS
ncbi:MAG: ScpA family protein [Candidatus Uhrbacteria bacterium]